MKTLIKIMIMIPFAIQAQEKKELPKSKVDYNSFLDISEEILQYREERLIPLHEFLEYMKDENTILLDTRSETAYKNKHLKGAIHINFSDFTKNKLAKYIPSKDTRILIYCNNNIDGDLDHFATKMAPLALNIPTFINLYGYGYKNIFELSSLVGVQDERLQFEGAAAK
ncbi:rhodanese-like domain-containing protein [Aquimarina celericrescens]|uniref:Rhodanese-like domain-containing protein n=1 Tax=Aquimarina celericrescens TaxID=1964542 RepID=A0ABW5B2M2_9FLAO|nr:rhodanese-like domain-containing protein [Aquimarina celericrescens]